MEPIILGRRPDCKPDVWVLVPPMVHLRLLLKRPLKRAATIFTGHHENPECKRPSKISVKMVIGTN